MLYISTLYMESVYINAEGSTVCVYMNMHVHVHIVHLTCCCNNYNCIFLFIIYYYYMLYDPVSVHVYI